MEFCLYYHFIFLNLPISLFKVSFPRRLRLPGSDSASETQNLIHEVWRLDKDEFASSYAIMR